jgi:hypothetical protein
MIRSALWVPAFDALAEPAVLVRLAAEAEERGWHGFFLWDRLSRPDPVRRVADPWIMPAAIATATARIRIGPRVTPVARRRPERDDRVRAAMLDEALGIRTVAHPDQFAEIVATLAGLRGDADGPYDIAVDLVRGVLRDGPIQAVGGEDR